MLVPLAKRSGSAGNCFNAISVHLPSLLRSAEERGLTPEQTDEIVATLKRLEEVAERP
jgi:hypothetical protein